MEDTPQPPQQPSLPDLNLPPRPRPEDPGYEVVDADGNLLVPGFKSVDGGHESTEPLKSSPPAPDDEQAATSSFSTQPAQQPPPNYQPPTANPQVRALILTGFGINCEEEFAAAYQLAGAEATIVHLNQVLHGHVSIHDYDILNFPGGFSFGDDLGSGVVLANKLRYRRNSAGGTLLDDIRAFVAGGKHVLGICNGFQVLVKLGLLPDLSGTAAPEVTLTHNASGRYENRWVRLKVNPQSNTPFLKGLDTLEVPVRHGEGRLVIQDADTRAAIEARGLNCLSYTDFDGSPTDVYPFNPNGAALNCAGLTDTTGRIVGLMPHPEAFLSSYNHPDWARRKRADAAVSEHGDGLRLFRNIVAHVASLPHPPAPSPGGEREPDGTQINRALQQKTGGRPRLTADKKLWYERLKPFSGQMRREPTPAEDALWQALRNRQLDDAKFRRQHAIGPFIVDFICTQPNLIVEVDGEVHDETGQAEYDAGRTYELEGVGYHVVRFTNGQVLHQLPTVLQKISEALLQHSLKN